jgi:hypothetical protein
LPESKYIVYGLIDPRTDEIRYVGKTITGVKRLRAHIKEARRGKVTTHKNRWIQSLLAAGVKPRLDVLQSALDPQELNALEQLWIKTYREKGANLTNHTDGGEGAVGLRMSDETRKKMSEAHKNSPHRERVLKALHKGAKAAAGRLSAERSASAAAWNERRWADPAAHEQMSAKMAGRVFSLETRAKQSVAQRKRFKDPAQKAALARARAMATNYSWSEERKLAQARNRGRGPFVDQYGNRYESVRAAARALNIDSSHLCKVLSGQRPHAKGYRFRYA